MDPNLAAQKLQQIGAEMKTDWSATQAMQASGLSEQHFNNNQITSALECMTAIGKAIPNTSGERYSGLVVCNIIPTPCKVRPFEDELIEPEVDNIARFSMMNNIPVCFNHILAHPCGRVERSYINPRTKSLEGQFRCDLQSDLGRGLHWAIRNRVFASVSLSHDKTTKKPHELSVCIGEPRREGAHIASFSKTAADFDAKPLYVSKITPEIEKAHEAISRVSTEFDTRQTQFSTQNIGYRFLTELALFSAIMAAPMSDSSAAAGAAAAAAATTSASGAAAPASQTGTPAAPGGSGGAPAVPAPPGRPPALLPHSGQKHDRSADQIDMETEQGTTRETTKAPRIGQRGDEFDVPSILRRLMEKQDTTAASALSGLSTRLNESDARSRSMEEQLNRQTTESARNRSEAQQLREKSDAQMREIADLREQNRIAQLHRDTRSLVQQHHKQLPMSTEMRATAENVLNESEAVEAKIAAAGLTEAMRRERESRQNELAVFSRHLRKEIEQPPTHNTGGSNTHNNNSSVTDADMKEAISRVAPKANFSKTSANHDVKGMDLGKKFSTPAYPTPNAPAPGSLLSQKQTAAQLNLAMFSKCQSKLTGASSVADTYNTFDNDDKAAVMAAILVQNAAHFKQKTRTMVSAGSAADGRPTQWGFREHVDPVYDFSWNASNKMVIPQNWPKRVPGLTPPPQAAY